MRSAARCTAVLLLFVATGGAAQIRDLVGVEFQARIVSVVDGDTVDAIPAGEQRAIRIRLEGVDTPERGEPFSDAARRFTRVMLFDQSATFDGRDVDRYGRLVARIRVGRQDASLALLEAGLACHYTQYSADRMLAAAEAKARREGQGFWASGAGKPRCTESTRAAAPSPRAPAVAVAATFHGNVESRVYHWPTCRNYTCRNCTRVFQSEAEAKAAGFRPAGDCLRR